MKFLVALYCFIGLAIYSVQANVTNELKEKYIILREVCIEKSGTTLETVKEARAGTYTDDDKLAAYFKCMFVKIGFMCPEGMLHPDVMLEKAKLQIDETKAKEIIDTCTAKTYSNVDKKAYEIFKCFRDAYGHSIDIV